MGTLLAKQALRKLLADNATIAGIVGTRVYMQWPTQGAVRPYLVLTQTSKTPAHHLLAASGLATVMMQIDAIVDAFEDLAHLTLIEAVRDAIDGRPDGTVTIGADTLALHSVRLQDDAESFDPAAGADQTVRRATADYRLVHAESVPTFT